MPIIDCKSLTTQNWNDSENLFGEVVRMVDVGANFFVLREKNLIKYDEMVIKLLCIYKLKKIS